MGNFSNNAITDVGRMLLADVQAGAIFTPTRIVMGSGSMPSGATPQGMTDVITPVKSLAINKKKRTPDGKCVFGGVYTNEEVTEPFYFRELALYAKAVYLNEDGSVKSEGAETLYSYGNAGATADYMPAHSTSTVVEKQMDLVTWVGNDAQVDLTIETGIFVTQGQAVLNMDYINPDTVGFDSLLEYMAYIYEQNVIVAGHISGFSDMPEGVAIIHGVINVVGDQLTVCGTSRTDLYFRGTNSLTQWTGQWRKAYDASEDLTIEKAIAAVKLVTPGGSGEVFKNANATDDLGTTISDGTKNGVTDRINLSADRTLADKLRLVVAGEKIYNILHTGNKELIKPEDIGAVKKAGDTMTDVLTIEKTAGPAVHIIEKNGAGGALQLWNDVLSLSNKNSVDDLNNYRLLSLANAKSEPDIVHALVLSNVTNGVQKYYTVLHAGNMAAFGLGVAPASVE